MPTPAATEGRPFPARVVTMQGADTGVEVCVCVGVGVDVTEAAMVEELLGVGDRVGVLEREAPLLGELVADKLKTAGHVSWRSR